MLGVGFNAMLPGEAQRSRGTRVCDRARKGIFRQKELGAQGGNRAATGPELDVYWEEGPYQ